MLLRRGLLAVVLIGGAFALGADSTSARTTARTVGNPSIEKIIFGGSAAHPGITVVGSDLTYDRNYSTAAPNPSPAYTPGGHPGCPRNFKGPQGHDYGLRLFLADKSGKPEWSAGRWRPSIGELDCIGVVIVQWTSGAIQFRLGSFYRIGTST